jgi:hypothetical protein
MIFLVYPKWLMILKPFMYTKGALPDTIIAGNLGSSRPPMYSPALTALLTSPHSRTTKPLSKSDIIRPRNLPACANPLSDEARIHGPFSKRREVNIRWRQFKTETKKLLPPLDACLANSIIKDPNRTLDANLENLENVESAVGELCRGPTKTRREQKDMKKDESRTLSDHRHPSRWVRRRYRWLLSCSPRLMYQSEKLLGVQISQRSFSPSQKPAVHMPEVDVTTMSWFRKPIVMRCQMSG